MRILVLIVALVFTCALAAFTVLDIAQHGFNGVDVFAGLILLLFATGILGALLQRPPKGPDELLGPPEELLRPPEELLRPPDAPPGRPRE